MRRYCVSFPVFTRSARARTKKTAKLCFELGRCYTNLTVIILRHESTNCGGALPCCWRRILPLCHFRLAHCIFEF